MNPLIQHLRNKLIVSIDVSPGNPCSDLDFIVAMAHAAMVGGAGAIRVGGIKEIKAISSSTSMPIIGFIKRDYPDYSIVRVTPTFQEAIQVANSGAQIIAIELTGRVRPDGLSDEEIVQKIKQELQVPIVADISTFDEAINAEKAGVDIIATTLVGYTPQSQQTDAFDFGLLKKLCQRINIPILAEGHITSPREAQKAVQMGAHGVVVGSMISKPHVITEKYSREIKFSQNMPRE